jgi:hypothetical protein
MGTHGLLQLWIPGTGNFLRKEEIHARAMQRHGDWSEQLNDYCQTSGLAMDNLITRILNCGFDPDDLKHLERLSCKNVLKTLPPEKRNLKHNVKDDVVLYLMGSTAGKQIAFRDKPSRISE